MTSWHVDNSSLEEPRGSHPCNHTDNYRVPSEDQIASLPPCTVKWVGVEEISFAGDLRTAGNLTGSLCLPHLRPQTNGAPISVNDARYELYQCLTVPLAPAPHTGAPGFREASPCGHTSPKPDSLMGEKGTLLGCTCPSPRMIKSRG